MAWIEPGHSRKDVDRAGDVLLEPTIWKTEIDLALHVINNWRSSHSYPLQVVKMTLLKRARAVLGSAVVAQRLKRLSSIHSKLARNKNMKLSQMQDLGGCRAVVGTVAEVHSVVKKYEVSRAKNPTARSELVKKYDYIAEPKTDGYRSIHFVFKYKSASKNREVYNGLRIEVQVRSNLQHYWATAVETVSTFTGQALKSNVGDDRWKRFFALMGTAIAIREKCPPVPNTPTNKNELREELRDLSRCLHVENVLSGWGKAVNIVEDQSDKSHVFLMVLNSEVRTVRVRGFSQADRSRASEEYLRLETENKDKPEIQTVLVSVDSIQALRTAYPNYFLDTHAFITVMKQAIR
jgi:hypothetical protein